MKDYYKITQSLFNKMEEQTPQWDKLRTRIMPRAQANATQEDSPQHTPQESTYSSVANLSLHILASAHLTYITPMDQRWFTLKPTLQGNSKNMQLEDWYAQATEQTYAALATSNFYTAIHEVYLDRCLTGTGCMFAELTQNKTLNFKHIPTGTYAIAEAKDGSIDTIARKFQFTAHQAAQEFGADSLPEKIKNTLSDDNKKYTDLFTFYQLVIPNDTYSFGSFDLPPEHRKWKDIYISEEEKKTIHEGGLYEFPFLVTRYLKFGASPYGESPGTNVLNEIDSSITIERILDTLGSRAAIPSILMLAEQVGEIDLRAGGCTVVTQEAASMNLPREWATAGQYDIGIARLQDKEEKIKQAFHVQMLQVISSVERQMTATEVNAREAEKVLAFNPSFTLFVSDFQHMMQRIFALLFRAQIYNQDKIPPQIFNLSADRSKIELATPQIRYTGKIAQAIDRIQRMGQEGEIQFVANYTQMTQDPSMLKCLKPYEILRFHWESSGAPINCILTKDEYDQMIQAEQQTAAQQAQIQQAAELTQIQQAQQTK